MKKTELPSKLAEIIGRVWKEDLYGFVCDYSLSYVKLE